MGPSAPSRKPNNHPFWGGKLATCPSNKGGGPPVGRCEFGERPKRGGCEGSPKGRSDRSERPHPAMDRLKNPNQRHQEPKPTPSRTQTHAKQNTHHQQQNTNTKKADPKSAHQQSITQERLSDLPPESESPHHPLLRAPTSPHNTKHEGAPTPRPSQTPADAHPERA